MYSPQLDPGRQYFRQLKTRGWPRDGYKPPPQQYQQRFINFHYRKQGSFYSVNSRTVIKTITPSQVTPQKDNWTIFLSRHEEPIQLNFFPFSQNLANFIPIQLIVLPLLGLILNIHFCPFFLFCRTGQFCRTGLIPNSDFPIYAISVQMVKMS